MNVVLKNNIASAEIKTMGAEVVSFKKLTDGCEYIWNGDGKFWASHSPVLFPIVCALNNGETKVDGKNYKIGNHGFVRKDEFQLVEADETKAVYKHVFSEKTLAMYPFKYELYLTYILVENTLKVEYKVVNVDDKEIYFQIGTHPGFNCPLAEGETFEDYYIEFEKNETLERLYMNDANVIISGKSDKVLENSSILPLNHKMFYDGALVFKNINSEKVQLKSKKSDKSVVLSYSDLPYMGLWQPKDAPFICIEPWHGVADVDTYTGEFKDKEMIINLEAGKSYQCSYEITIK